MRGRPNLDEVVREIMIQMYEEANPPAEYPNHVDSYEDHYLSIERQLQIVSDVCRIRRVGAIGRRIVEREVFTGDCPNTQELFAYEASDRR